MKKLLIVVIIILLTGCSKKLEINQDIININYNKYNLAQEDYNKVINYLNQINFSCGKNQNYSTTLLSIRTTSTIINFNLSSNYYMEYQENNKYCYTKDKEKVKNLIFLLDELIEKYTNNNFYTIEFLTDYQESNDDINIRLDKSSEYIIINTSETITNFKINEIEFNDNYFDEINLIYQKDIIEPNRIVIRKLLGDMPNYKISFMNNYGYTFHIVPTYDGITGNIVFKTEIK